VAQVACLGEPFGDRQPRSGVTAVEDVVRRFGAAREPPDTIELAERPESLESAGQELVRVGLVPGVPDDPVARRLEQPMERDREFDDAQRGSEMAARSGHGSEDGLADLDRQLRELELVEAA